MKFLNKVKLLFTPSDDYDAVNKKYVDEHIANVDLTNVTEEELLTTKDNKIVSTNVPVKDLLYGKDEELIETEITNLTNADTLGGYSISEIIEIINKSIGLENVTNDKQMKARNDEDITEGNVAVWTSDGSLLKDTGVYVKKSVPENAIFTDTTYEEATSTESGLLNYNDKIKLDKLDEYKQFFQFKTIEEMANFDMSSYPYDYAYGLVLEQQFRYKKSNENLSTYGKWRQVIELAGDLITFDNFRIDSEGYMYVDIIQKDSGGTIIATSPEMIGKVSIVPKGDYDDSIEYSYLNMVRQNGILYICKVSSSIGIPPTDATNWMICTDKALNNYELYAENTTDDPILTLSEWLDKQKGADGKDGTIITNIYQNDDGELMIDVTTDSGNTTPYNLGRYIGYSAYEIAVQKGFVGDEDDWLASLKGGGSEATSLSIPRNINGLLFDGTSDITNLAICNTEANVSEKVISVTKGTLDNGLFYIYFAKENTCTNIKIKLNSYDSYNVYYQEELFDASVITAGTVLNVIFNNNKFIVVGISNINEEQVKKLIEEVTGDLAILTTTQKDTLTDSINELVDNIDDNKNNIGELGNLLTTNKDTLVDALNEVFQSGCDFKEALSNAITAKDPNVTISNPKKATIQDFINAINEMTVDTSDATATEENILVDKIAYISSGKTTGTMPNKTILDSSIGGINSDNPTVPVHIGTAPQLGTQTGDNKTRFCVCPPKGYWPGGGSSYVGVPLDSLASVLGITEDKIVAGNTICGVTGTVASINLITGTYNSVPVSYVKKPSGSLTIPINLSFAPKYVFVKLYAYYDTYSSTSSSYSCYGVDNPIWILAGSGTIQFGAWFSSGTKYGLYVTVTANQSNIYINWNYNNSSYYKNLKIYQWIAIG